MSEGGKGAGGGDAGNEAEPAVMRRLLDELPGDPPTPRGWALGLLRRAQPHRAPVGRKQRVRLALGQGGKRRAVRFLRPAIAGVVLMGCGAAASAALGRWPEFVQAYHRLLAPADAPVSVADARARRWASGQAARRGSRATGVETAPSSEPPDPEVAPQPGPSAASPPSSGTRAALHGSSASWRPRRTSARVGAVAGKTAGKNAAKIAAKTARRPAPAEAMTAPAPAPVGVAEAPDDTAPVLEAMRALRVESNPVRARRLLAGYLDRHPGGSLAEEALAMSIEAAVAHGDDDATALARKYVRRYPSGHFAGLARRTLDGAASSVH
jgi:hypothetical protein